MRWRPHFTNNGTGRVLECEICGRGIGLAETFWLDENEYGELSICVDCSVGHTISPSHYQQTSEERS